MILSEGRPYKPAFKAIVCSSNHHNDGTGDGVGPDAMLSAIPAAKHPMSVQKHYASRKNVTQQNYCG
jgi:hypothetical protein